MLLTTSGNRANNLQTGDVRTRSLTARRDASSSSSDIVGLEGSSAFSFMMYAAAELHEVYPVTCTPDSPESSSGVYCSLTSLAFFNARICLETYTLAIFVSEQRAMLPTSAWPNSSVSTSERDEAVMAVGARIELCGPRTAALRTMPTRSR